MASSALSKSDARQLLAKVIRWNGTAEFYRSLQREDRTPASLLVAREHEATYRRFVHESVHLVKDQFPVDKIKSEKDLRKWLRDMWKDDEDVQLTRLEPGMGCTVGVPDVLLLLKGNWLPIELKHGDLKGGYLNADIRPAQVQWHLSVAKAGGRSLFLVSTDKGVFMVPGRFVLELKGKKWEDWPQHCYHVIKLKHEFVACLEDERFWSGEKPEKKELASKLKPNDKISPKVPASRSKVKCPKQSSKKPSQKKTGKPKAAKQKAPATSARSSVAPKSKSKKTKRSRR